MTSRAGAGAVPRGASPTVAAAAVLGVALAAWVLLVARMGGMDAGPGAGLGGVAWFTGAWVTMTAAMMLPSAAPTVAVVARVSGARGATPRGSLTATGAFAAGYLVAWTAFGLVAYVAFRAVDAAGAGALAWDRSGPLLAGAAVVLAGAYQLTPLRRACLRRWRTPLALLMHRWRRGSGGAFVMGLEHGAWCLGCCAGLMLALLAVGVMSPGWMAAVAAVVLAEKVASPVPRLPVAVAVCLVALGAWIAVSPGTVPGLTGPEHHHHHIG